MDIRREDPGTTSPGTLRVAGVLAPLSLVMDLGMGAPGEESMRTCLLATHLARRMGLAEQAVADVYYATMLRHLGCTATAHEEALHFGRDEHHMRPLIGPTDFGRPAEMMRLVAKSGRGRPPLARARLALRMATSNAWGRGIERAVCEVASMLAERLGFNDEVQAATGQSFERWDGKGNRRLKGEEIALAARFFHVAGRAMAFHAEQGADAARFAVRQSAGGWLDPSIAAAFDEYGSAILAEIDSVDPLDAVLECEPVPHRAIRENELDGLAATFGDMVDLKSPFTFEHSRGVAELSKRAARALGCGPSECRELANIARLHDLGRVGVPGGVWEKPGALTSAERERMQLHPYYTERILGRVPRFADMAAVAGMHHERLDGSGYHRGAAAREQPLSARILAAADAFHTMLERRPHREAITGAAAADRLVENAAKGAFDVDVARAIVEAAGNATPSIVRTLPNGLTERELEVLRLVAIGRSNREIADALVISRRTAEHHVQHIYDKVGVSTRAAVSMFAMQHDLLASGSPGRLDE